MRALNKEQLEYALKQRDAFQQLLEHIREKSLSSKVVIIEQSNEWYRSLATISVALGAAIAPLIISNQKSHESWAMPVIYLGILILVGNGIYIFIRQKINLESDINRLDWVGKKEELGLAKMIHSLNKVLWYKTSEKLLEYQDISRTIQSEETRMLAEPPRGQKVNFGFDTHLFLLALGVYMIVSYIWRWGSLWYFEIGDFLVVLYLVTLLIGTHSALKNYDKSRESNEAIKAEDSAYMKWYESVHKKK